MEKQKIPLLCSCGNTNTVETAPDPMNFGKLMCDDCIKYYKACQQPTRTDWDE